MRYTGAMTSSSAARADAARLFLALWPGPRARVATLGWQAAIGWPGTARLTAPEHLHLTLHFIGQVPRERLPELIRGLVVPVPRMELMLDQVDVWPNQVCALTPRRTPRALADLRGRLGGALERLGLDMERRPYRPHVTLARHARGAKLGGHVPPPVCWRAASYVLAESAGGYRALARWP